MLKEIIWNLHSSFLFTILANQTQLLKNCKDKKALASYIKHTSFKIFLCSKYEKRNLKYVLFNKKNSGCCLECVCYKVSYNMEGILISK